MKTLIPLLAGIACSLLAPVAEAAVYLGSWKNTTFGSSGPLRIEFERSRTKVAVSFDLDGPVFGSIDPPAIRFNAPLDSKGGGRFNVKGTPLGDLSGTFSADGALNVAIRNIPGGTLTEFRFKGKFNLVMETFKGTYEIDNAGGLFAKGTANALVPKAPKITLPKTVRFSGKSATASAKVTSNTKITKVTATTPDGAKVVVSGKGPYRITVSRIKKAETKVTLKVTNASGKTARKVVTFVKS
jgi:hypothetical protein